MPVLYNSPFNFNFFQVAQVKGAGPPPAVPSPGDAALLALVRQSCGGGGGVRLYTEQDLLEGRAKGHHQMQQQQQQRPRFSHPAIPPPLLRVRNSFFKSVLWIAIVVFVADPDPTWNFGADNSVVEPEPEP
jgi:hypothetical protein